MKYKQQHRQPMEKAVSIRLPTDLDAVWRYQTELDPAMFGRWAIAATALRFGWVKAADLELLPYISADGNDFELLPIGQVPPGFIPGWL
jgi:hypothetical protein